MSAAEKLKALERSVAQGGDFDSRPCDTAQNDAGWALTEALPQIVAIVEGAEALPMLFDVIEGSTIVTRSFVPLLDELDKALS